MSLTGGVGVTLGLAQRQGDLLDDLVTFCDEVVGEGSIYGWLHRERDRLFPDEAFADLYTDRGRRSVPPSVLACVMVLQRLEGCSDREAADRFTFDARWRYAAGVGGWGQGPTSFVHTVLVRTRMRLRASEDPDRVFRISKEVAAEAGLVGAKRALDSAPLFDAVATQDTVTLIRSAIRGLLRAADAGLKAELGAVLSRDDCYTSAGKPVCDWDDADAREALIDALVRDGMACVTLLEGRELSRGVSEAVALLATVLGQDIEEDDAGRFRIACRVAPDRVISTVDTQARHGRKTSAGGFDGYKGHIAVDPDSEIVTAAAVGPANGGDADLTATLLEDLTEAPTPVAEAPTDADCDTETVGAGDDGGDTSEIRRDEGQPGADTDTHLGAGNDEDNDEDNDGGSGGNGGGSGGGDAQAGNRPVVYGDAAYGSGDNLEHLERLDAEAMVKTQPASAPGGRFSKDAFDIDLDAATVTCPAQHTVPIGFRDDGSATVTFAEHCGGCPLRERCTTSKTGRSIQISRHERLLAAARARQRDPAWQADYRATRPKVERKLAHLTRRGHGGRRVRMRGQQRSDQDWKLLAGALNCLRLATLGVRNVAGRWQPAAALS